MNKESKLYKVLCDFNGTHGSTDGEKMIHLASEFEKIAMAAFNSGYFLINKGDEDYEYKIEITCIEFYYHEDKEGGIKDPRKLLKGKDTFDYELGAVCPHNYGVDILFDDNNEKQYHASFLIRGFRVCEKGKEPYDNGDADKEEWHPQYIWDYLFGGANMLKEGKFSIEWIDQQCVPDEQVSIQTKARIFSKKNPLIGDDRLWMYLKK
jgi:hypothetical protein